MPRNWCYCVWTFSIALIAGCAPTEWAQDASRPAIKPPAASQPAFPHRFLIAVDEWENGSVVRTKYGYIDETGRVVIQPTFDQAQRFYEGLAWVMVGDRQAFIDTDGRIAFYLPPGTYSAQWFSEGLALVNVGGGTDYHRMEGGKWGYINQRGEFAIPATFVLPADTSGFDFSMNPVSSFSEGMAGMIGPNGKWGYIDRFGNWAIPPQFAEVQPFWSELAKVTFDDKGREGYVDKNGAIVWQQEASSPAGAKGS